MRHNLDAVPPRRESTKNWCRSSKKSLNLGLKLKIAGEQQNNTITEVLFILRLSVLAFSPQLSALLFQALHFWNLPHSLQDLWLPERCMTSGIFQNFFFSVVIFFLDLFRNVNVDKITFLDRHTDSGRICSTSNHKS